MLVFMTDQQSAEAMSCCLGEHHIRTPNMDRLAAEGVRFDHAYCAHPLCVPSRSAMWTGRYPHEIGVMTNDDHTLDHRRFPCLVTHLKHAGYDTGYVGKWHASIPDSRRAPVAGGPEHGFDFCENNACNTADIRNSDVAIRFLNIKRDRPFFLVVSYNNPHNICEWARGARTELPDGDFALPPPLEQCPPPRSNLLPPEDETDTIALMRRSYHAAKTFPVGGFEEKEWRELAWAYYRMVELVDHRMGRVLDALEQTGERENTLILFVSDHGDCQGAHRWNQKTVLYDESTRVPCIMSWPGHIRPSISNTLVQTGIDVMPTLLDAAGITVPNGLPGASQLSELVSGTPSSSRPYIVTETKFAQGADIDGQRPMPEGRMVRSDRFKHCVYDLGNRRESLCDMESDPGETRNLARDPEYREVLEQHREYLRAFCTQAGDGFLSAVPAGTR
jgi:arylsulfatase A-like enzyme